MECFGRLFGYALLRPDPLPKTLSIQAIWPDPGPPACSGLGSSAKWDNTIPVADAIVGHTGSRWPYTLTLVG